MLSAIGIPPVGATSATATAVAVAAAARVLVRCATGAVAATLAVASTRNMYQTWSVCTSSRTLVPAPPTSSHHNPDRQDGFLLVDDDEELSRMEKGELPRALTTGTEQIVHQLQKMNRRQLLQLYLDPTKCSAPSKPSRSELFDLEGEWEGVLLENHGSIMTWVANLLTHRFFTAAAARRQGQGRAFSMIVFSPTLMWRGKVFSRGGASGENIDGGANRIGMVTMSNRLDEGQIASVGAVEHHHPFDVAIGTTRFPSGRRRQQNRDSLMNESEGSDSANLALFLTYHRHQPWYSPWKTMTDEVRVVRASSELGRPTVLLGWGCMAWSGGILNASPFCLYRKDSGSN